MPRMPFPEDTDDFSDETRAAVRHILETRKSMPPPSSYLTYAGEAGARLSDLVDHLRYRTSLTVAESELAIIVANRAANADFIWNAHVKLGLAAGMREEAINAVDTYGPLDDLTDDEALIIQFGRELLEAPGRSKLRCRFLRRLMLRRSSLYRVRRLSILQAGCVPTAVSKPR